MQSSVFCRRGSTASCSVTSYSSATPSRRRGCAGKTSMPCRASPLETNTSIPAARAPMSHDTSDPIWSLLTRVGRSLADEDGSVLLANLQKLALLLNQRRWDDGVSSEDDANQIGIWRQRRT